MKKKYNMKKTISFGMFISEFGEAFTSHMKLRLLEIGKRCVLIRKADYSSFDLKHVEHTKYDCGNVQGASNKKLKEYTYGQFLVKEGILYFSDVHIDGDDVIQYPAIGKMYRAIEAEVELFDENKEAKRLQDSNIDYLVDNLLAVCPQLSSEYLKIISEYKE